MGNLDQKVVVVTGGAKGIGKQIALTFAREGANIVIADIIEMEETARAVGELGRMTITVTTDVSKREEVKNLIDTTINNFGKIDVLVNNAGTTRGAAGLLKVSEEDWDIVLGVNLKGVFLCIQAAAKHMVERKSGKIINISSVSGLSTYMRNEMHNYSYAILKAGIIMLTKFCARELGRHGINVNAIAPGLVSTDMLYVRRTPEQVKEFIENTSKQVPLGRIGATQDVANLALFLASDDSSYITGQVISVDGGGLSETDLICVDAFFFAEETPMSIVRAYKEYQSVVVGLNGGSNDRI